MPDKIRVTAIERGYYGGVLRDPGATFVINDKQDFSSVWMQMDGGPAKPEAKPADPVEAEVVDESDGDDDLDGGKLKRCRLFRKVYKSEDGRREVAGDDALIAAVKSWMNEDAGRDAAGWNALKDDERRSRILKEVDRLLAA